MAVRAESFRAGLDLILGSYAIAAETLAITLLDDTWVPPGLDAAGITFDATAEAETLWTINIASQAWSFDAVTRTNVLVPTGTIAFTVGGVPKTFQYGVLHDQDNAHAPFTLLTWPTGQTVAASSTHSLDLDSLMNVRLFSDQSPAPLFQVYSPLVLTAPDGTHWRVLKNTVLSTQLTSEVDPREVYIQSADANYHLIEVSNTGVVTATGSSPLTPSDGARVFTHSTGNNPCLIPSTEGASVQIMLTVSNAGAFTLTTV